MIRKFELADGLRNRELKSEADVDALLKKLRERLMEQIRTGVRVRLS